MLVMPVQRIAGAARVHTSDFTSDYVYHAQMEPHSCTAWVKPDGVEVWTGTQWPTRSVAEAAKAAGVAPEKVKLHPLQMGGSFGRNAFVEYVIGRGSAVEGSAEAGEDDPEPRGRHPGRALPADGRPAHRGRSRQRRQGASAGRIASQPRRSCLTSTGRRGWTRRRASITSSPTAPTWRSMTWPRMSTEHIYEERGVRTAAWRGIGAGHNNFAIEVVIDELALARRRRIRWNIGWRC